MQRLLLGDWNRVVRDPIDLLRIAFLVGVAVFAAMGDVKGTANLAFGTAGVLVARAVGLPRIYDLSFVLAMFLVAWGEALGFYDAIEWYDNLVHFLVPLLASPVAYIGLARLHVVPDLREETHLPHYVGIFLLTLAIGLAVGAVWEMIEYSSDRWLDTELSLGNSDTVGDLMFDGAGALIGGALLVVWARWGWGTTRRELSRAG